MPSTGGLALAVIQVLGDDIGVLSAAQMKGLSTDSIKAPHHRPAGTLSAVQIAGPSTA